VRQATRVKICVGGKIMPTRKTGLSLKLRPPFNEAYNVIQLSPLYFPVSIISSDNVIKLLPALASIVTTEQDKLLESVLNTSYSKMIKGLTSQVADRKPP